MITPETFQPGWIEQLRRRHKNIHPNIAEKMILALTLVERLAQEPIPFVFKGGTCLVLLLGKVRRFSVDVDIVTETSPEELAAALSRIAENPPFLRVEYDEKRSTKDNIPRGHYYLYFSPILNQKRSADHPDPYIALDVLYEAHGYPELREVPVDSEFLVTDSPTQLVRVPSVESITGDKLTAFAPRTTGIPYGKGKEVEIVKQLFDVSVLFDEVNDVESVAKSYAATVAKELTYRQLSQPAAEVLRDTIQTALLLAQHKINPAKTLDQEGIQELLVGIQGFANFLIDTRFNMDIAVTAAAKAAYLAARLIGEDYSVLPRYKNQPVAGLRVTDDPQLLFLNKLRSTPEAMFFWQQTVQLLTQHEQMAVITPYAGRSQPVETLKTPTRMSTTINITTQPDQHLLIARWSGPGIEEDFTYDDRAMLSKAQETNCWRWLADFRIHGDTNAHNADDFFRTILPDAKAAGRFATGITLRVAILIRPDFAILSAQVPNVEFQKRRGYVAKTFTDEGQAMQWLLEA